MVLETFKCNPAVTIKAMFKSALVRRVCLVLCICACQFLIILPAVCYRLPFSPYFRFTSPSAEYISGRVKVLNKERLKQSYAYFNSQQTGDSLTYYKEIGKSSTTYLVVAIVTVNRSHGNLENEGLGYIIQSASGVDAFSKSREFAKRTFVFVCNVDPKPNMHKDAEYLKDYLPFVERYGSASFNMSDIRLPDNSTSYRQRTHSDTFEKETFDYSFCLNVAQTFKPRYILVVEDDAIPHKDLAEVLSYSLDNHLSKSYRTNLQAREFVYLKLYYPEKWQGFAFEIYQILELLSIGYVGGGVYLLFVYAWLKMARKRTTLSLGHFVFGVIFVILTVKLVGRQHVLELRRFSKYFYQFRPSPDCCTPAMLYPAAIVDPLTSHLTSVKSSIHTDLAIADFVHRSNIPAYQLVPNLFHHIGLHTSLQKGGSKPEFFLM